MTVQIDIDKATLAELDEAVEVLQEDREEVLRRGFQKIVKEMQREAEVAKKYREAYSKNPIQPDEFEVEEEQLIEAWKDL